jgi:hypothetical protein
MLYQVQFEDGSIYNGGNSYKETKWNDIPDKSIKQIAFTLPDGNLLVLRGYEKFNHFCEATQDIYGSNKFTLRYQYLMGKLGDKVISYRITLFQIQDARYRIGDITRREYEYGKEYNNRPTNGWKEGIKKDGNTN